MDTQSAYALSVRREIIAQHYLTVPDPGPEGDLHSHRYILEVAFGGPALDEYGYLVDIDAVNDILDELEGRYRDTVLNDLPEFGDQNPSVERFATHVADRIEAGLDEGNPTRLTVRIREDEEAWASHSRPLEG